MASACSAQLIPKNFKCLSTYRHNQKTSYPESHTKATCSKDDLEHEQKENKLRY
jgi:transcription elongation factor Elf1